MENKDKDNSGLGIVVLTIVLVGSLLLTAYIVSNNIEQKRMAFGAAEIDKSDYDYMETKISLAPDPEPFRNKVKTWLKEKDYVSNAEFKELEDGIAEQKKKMVIAKYKN